MRLYFGLEVKGVSSLKELKIFAMGKASQNEEDGAGHTITQYKPKIAKPSFYKVLLLNDDFTPMDFVVLVLKKFFSKTDAEATQIMLQVHHQGAGTAGVYSHEVAETKVYLVNEFSKGHEHPLKCSMEKEG